MTDNVSAEIISIGTEILLGELTDTNSVYLARVLRDLGINLYTMVSVGDNRARIAQAVRVAMDRTEVVITCGGLGPTVDDVTRDAVADATNRDLEFHQSLLDKIAGRFESFGVRMTDNNRQQAYLPTDAIVIDNPVGTAPCFIVEHNNSIVICLPGVPRELKFLMAETVVPYLRQKHDLGIIVARTLKTAGIGESSLDDLLGRDLLEGANPTIGLNAHMGQIDIRITAKAETEARANQLIGAAEQRVRERAGRYIFGADDDTLETVFVEYCRANGVTVALAQAGVPDIIGDAIQAAGGSDIITVNHVMPHPKELLTVFEMDAFTSMRDTGKMLAEKLADDSGAHVSIVILSLPDVEEGSDSDEATVIGVMVYGTYRDRVYGFGGQSDFARAWGKSWLLSNTWRMLKEHADAD